MPSSKFELVLLCSKLNGLFCSSEARSSLTGSTTPSSGSMSEVPNQAGTLEIVEV